MNRSSEFSIPDMDAAIRHGFALAGPHLPQIDIAAAALDRAQKKQAATIQHTRALQRMNRLWRAMTGAATVIIFGIIILALLWSLSASSQTTTIASAAESSTTYVAHSSTVTVALEWILLAAGLAIAWLIITSIFRAIGSETYEGILA